MKSISNDLWYFNNANLNVAASLNERPAQGFETLRKH
jgi:hypothetical protein